MKPHLTDITPENTVPPLAPFIVGFPRSGTTLLRLMIDAHPLFAVPPETQFLVPIVCSRESQAVTAVYRLITGSARWPDFGIDKTTLLQSFRDLDEGAGAVAVRRFYGLYARQHSKQRWGDKTPRYGRILRPLKAFLPETLFVHLIRDGRDAFASSKTMARSVVLNPRQHAARWVTYINSVRSESRGFQDYFELRYERLIRDTRIALSEICGRLSVEFNDQMLTYFHDAPRRMQELADIFGPNGMRLLRANRLNWHTNVARAPDETRIGRWRSLLTRQEKSEYSRIAGPLLDSLGYEHD